MNELVYLIIIIAASVIVGVLAGNGAVYVFNKLPATWLCDYGEEPSDEVRSVGRQRVKSLPWKYVFSASFVVAGIYMGMSNWQYAIAGIIACWLLLLTAIADKKYRIIPDQTVLVLALAGCGFVPFLGGARPMLEGLLVGSGVMLVIWLVTRLIYGKDAMGFGDVKLCAVVGLITGVWGGLATICLGAISCGVFAAVRLIRGKAKRNDAVPMGPFLCGAAMFYIVVVQNEPVLQGIFHLW